MPNAIFPTTEELEKKSDRELLLLLVDRRREDEKRLTHIEQNQSVQVEWARKIALTRHAYDVVEEIDAYRLATNGHLPKDDG